MFSYLLLRDNKQSGPYNFNELKAIGIKETDLLWIEGRSTFWQSPKEIDELLPFLMPYASTSVNLENRSRRELITPKTEKPDTIKSISSTETATTGKTEKVSNRTKWDQEEKSTPNEIGTIRKNELLKSLQSETSARTRLDADTPSRSQDTVGKQGWAPITVFIADDHTLYREGVKIALASHTHIKIIGEALNGAQLLTMLQEKRPDVILLDIEMPVMDGITTLKKIRTLYPSQKVIMLSMHEDRSMVTTLMEAGANAYLSKTDDTETICKAIKTCSEQEYFFTDRTNLALLEELKSKKKPREKKVNTEFDGKDLMLKLKAAQIKQEREKAIQNAMQSAMFWILGLVVFVGCGYALIHYADDLQRAYDRWLKGSTLENVPAHREYRFFPPFIAYTQDEFPLSEKEWAQSQSLQLSNFSNATNLTTEKTSQTVQVTKKKPATPLVVTVSENASPAVKEALPVQQDPKGTVAETELEKNVPATRVNLNALIQASVSDYKVGALGGIFDIQVSVKNNSPYKVDEVVVQVDYFLSSEKVFKTELLTFTNIAPESTLTKEAPKSSRGVRIEYKIRSIQSKENGG